MTGNWFCDLTGLTKWPAWITTQQLVLAQIIISNSTIYKWEFEHTCIISCIQTRFSTDSRVCVVFVGEY